MSTSDNLEALDNTEIRQKLLQYGLDLPTSLDKKFLLKKLRQAIAEQGELTEPEENDEEMTSNTRKSIRGRKSVSQSKSVDVKSPKPTRKSLMVKSPVTKSVTPSPPKLTRPVVKTPTPTPEKTTFQRSTRRSLAPATPTTTPSSPSNKPVRSNSISRGSSSTRSSSRSTLTPAQADVIRRRSEKLSFNVTTEQTDSDEDEDEEEQATPPIPSQNPISSSNFFFSNLTPKIHQRIETTPTTIFGAGAHSSNDFGRNHSPNLNLSLSTRKRGLQSESNEEGPRTRRSRTATPTRSLGNSSFSAISTNSTTTPGFDDGNRDRSPFSSTSFTFGNGFTSPKDPVFKKAFALLVNGRMVQTDYTPNDPVDPKKFVFELKDADSIEHIAVFLTGNESFPAGTGGQIFFGWPNSKNEIQWQQLGYISNITPSGLFRIADLKQASGPVGGLAKFSSTLFGKQSYSSGGATANVGISIEPLDVIVQTMRAGIQLL